MEQPFSDLRKACSSRRRSSSVQNLEMLAMERQINQRKELLISWGMPYPKRHHLKWTEHKKVSSSQVMKHPGKERDASEKACLRLARNTWSQTHQEDLIKFSDKSKPGFTLILIRHQSSSTSSCKRTVFTSAITHPVPDRRTNRLTP